MGGGKEKKKSGGENEEEGDRRRESGDKEELRNWEIRVRERKKLGRGEEGENKNRMRE